MVNRNNLLLFNLLFDIYCFVGEKKIEKNSTLNEIQVINKTTAEVVWLHVAHRTRGLVRKPSPWGSTLLLRDSHKPREPLGPTGGHSQLLKTPQLRLAPFTAQLHQIFEELQKSHHLVPWENILGSLEENSQTSYSWHVLFISPPFLFSFSFPQVIAIDLRSHAVLSSPCWEVISSPQLRKLRTCWG